MLEFLYVTLLACSTATPPDSVEHYLTGLACCYKLMAFATKAELSLLYPCCQAARVHPTILPTMVALEYLLNISTSGTVRLLKVRFYLVLLLP